MELLIISQKYTNRTWKIEIEFKILFNNSAFHIEYSFICIIKINLVFNDLFIIHKSCWNMPSDGYYPFRISEAIYENIEIWVRMSGSENITLTELFLDFEWGLIGFI